MGHGVNGRDRASQRCVRRYLSAACVALIALGGAGCRLNEQPEYNPNHRGGAVADDAGETTDLPSGDGGGGEPSSPPQPSDDGGPAAMFDASEPRAGSDAGNGSGSATGSGSDASTMDDPTQPSDQPIGVACDAKPMGVCNPLTNEGCAPELSQQCAVDLAAPNLAGYCIFSAPLDGGAVACLNTGLTESCPPTETCFGGECRRYCLCDDQCDAGQCCTDPIGTQGFKVCGDC